MVEKVELHDFAPIFGRPLLSNATTLNQKGGQTQKNQCLFLLLMTTQCSRDVNVVAQESAFVSSLKEEEMSLEHWFDTTRKPIIPLATTNESPSLVWSVVVASTPGILGRRRTRLLGGERAWPWHYELDYYLCGGEDAKLKTD
jgi:hypothetical protein